MRDSRSSAAASPHLFHTSRRRDIVHRCLAGDSRDARPPSHRVRDERLVRHRPSAFAGGLMPSACARIADGRLRRHARPCRAAGRRPARTPAAARACRTDAACRASCRVSGDPEEVVRLQHQRPRRRSAPGGTSAAPAGRSRRRPATPFTSCVAACRPPGCPAASPASPPAPPRPSAGSQAWRLDPLRG